MFVVMALVTTVSTTPLTSFLYPVWYQRKLEAWKRGEIDWDGNRLSSEVASDTTPERSIEKLQSTQVRRLLVYLRLDSLPSLFTFIALLGGDRATIATKIHKSKMELETVLEGELAAPTSSKRPLEVHGLRMLELTERTSSVMKVSEGEDYSYRDPVVNAFRTFAQLNNVAVSGGVSVVPEDSYAETLNDRAVDYHSDLVLIPWTETSNIPEDATAYDAFSSGIQDAFIQKTLDKAACNTAIFVNRGFGGPLVQEPRTLTRTVSGLSLRSQREPVIQPIADRSHHVYFPFFGGNDDRVALRFVLQLAQNSNVTATIIHFISPLQSKPSQSPEVISEITRATSGPINSTLAISERVDTEVIYANTAQDTALLHTLRDSLPQSLSNRVVFVDVPTTSPVTDSLRHARQEVAQSPRNAGDLIVVGRGKHAPFASAENEPGLSAPAVEMRKTLGIVAETLISGGVRGSVLVIQATGKGLDI
jgi:hypothetical protein